VHAIAGRDGHSHDRANKSLGLVSVVMASPADPAASPHGRPPRVRGSAGSARIPFSGRPCVVSIVSGSGRHAADSLDWHPLHDSVTTSPLTFAKDDLDSGRGQRRGEATQQIGKDQRRLGPVGVSQFLIRHFLLNQLQ
jgi:hypothetical protein